MGIYRRVEPPGECGSCRTTHSNGGSRCTVTLVSPRPVDCCCVSGSRPAGRSRTPRSRWESLATGRMCGGAAIRPKVPPGSKTAPAALTAAQPGPSRPESGASSGCAGLVSGRGASHSHFRARTVSKPATLRTQIARWDAPRPDGPVRRIGGRCSSVVPAGRRPRVNRHPVRGAVATPNAHPERQHRTPPATAVRATQNGALVSPQTAAQTR
jgi:hypothetical protein